MAADDNLDSACARIKVELVQIVNNVKLHVVCSYRLSIGDGFRPGLPVIVALDGNHRRNTLQGLDHFWRTNVTAVYDKIDACESVERLRPDKPMGIRD